ncbi:MAG TPA: aldo/keto reductase [Planctomycetaceae bacterium]|nr:aldo/keto reductase [Planctomycetaceae bacterium]
MPNDFLTFPARGFGKPVSRLGLASRGGSEITPDDVFYAVDRGVNFLNWPGEADGPCCDDGLSQAIAALGQRRESVVVCVQFGSRTAGEAASELRSILATLRTKYIDCLTLYYVEHADEWRQLIGPGGALDCLKKAKRDGLVRRIGLTSHQRTLAADMAKSDAIDVLMIRYNAAHRGAEREIFPVTDALEKPVIAYTALRWGALLRPTSGDPPDFELPGAIDWYRFVLQLPSVAVVLAAPNDRTELEHDLDLLAVRGPLPDAEYARLAAHGDRVRQSAGSFP